MSIQQNQQDIASAEAALIALGPLTSANFDKALAQLVLRKNAQQDLVQSEMNQFFTNGFSLISQIQSDSTQTDKTILVSQYLRTFAEYIATQTQALQADNSTVSAIVDAIAPMPTS
jgi:hypothetical protein